jgi:hypothetical protein
MFLVGSMNADVSLKGFKDRCPCCGESGPFHTPSKKELLEKVPESGKWISYLAFPLAVTMLFTILGGAIVVVARMLRGQ